MVRTKSFRGLVEKNVKDDKKFAEALLREGIYAMLTVLGYLQKRAGVRLHVAGQQST